MAALTFAQAKTLIANQIGESDSAFTDDVATWDDPEVLLQAAGLQRRSV